MYNEKSLQDVEQGGNNCVKDHMVSVRKIEHSRARLETKFRKEAAAVVN